jgi:hypothetical protein
MKFTAKLSGILMMLTMIATPAFAGDAPPSPLDGYTIHVSAPHMMDGEVIGPFHHYCKPINSEIIQCILFESTEPNARMTEVEYMVSKKLVRNAIPGWSHQQNWHDHKQEIDTGRVAVHYPTDEKTVKAIVEHVSDTDGIIFHLWPKGAPIPDGSVMIAQSVGHWEALHGMVEGKAVVTAPSTGPGTAGPLRQLTHQDYVQMGITGNH